MVETRRDARFIHEHRDELGIVFVRRAETLHDRELAEARPLRSRHRRKKHLGHSAFPKLRDELIFTERYGHLRSSRSHHPRRAFDTRLPHDAFSVATFWNCGNRGQRELRDQSRRKSHLIGRPPTSRTEDGTRTILDTSSRCDRSSQKRTTPSRSRRLSFFAEGPDVSVRTSAVTPTPIVTRPRMSVVMLSARMRLSVES